MTSQKSSIEQDADEHLPLFLALFAILVGAVLMLSLVLRSDFPRCDGGMFYVMVKDLISNGYRLPNNTSYNYIQLPYVYPPLSFYLAALIADVFKISLIEIERWLPFIFCLLSILALGLLARSILKSNLQAALSMLAFALLPPAFDDLIMGGGLARAPGLFFSLLSLNWIYKLYFDKSRQHILPAIVFSTLTILTHPQFAWFTAFSAALMFAFSRPGRQDILHSILVAMGVIVLSAVWWIDILALHGSSNFAAAFTSRTALSWVVRLAQLYSFDFTSERLLDILGVMALIGLVRKIIDREFFFLVWLVAIFMLERTSPLPLVAVPLGMLIGVGVDALVFHNPAVSTPFGKRVLFTTFCLFVFYSLFATYTQLAPNHLSKETRNAMQWVAANIPVQSRFIVLTSNDWWEDPNSEWFPALAERASVNTVQGFEWIPGQGLARRISAYDLLRQCLRSSDVNCLNEWQWSSGEEFTYVFIPEPITYHQEPVYQDQYLRLLEGLLKSPSYTVIYNQSGGTIFKKIQ